MHHYVNVLLAQDRVNNEHLPIDVPIAHLRTLPNTAFLPSADDVQTLRADVLQVVCLILLENVPAFSAFKGIIAEHFTHRYSEEMKKKTLVNAETNKSVNKFINAGYVCRSWCWSAGIID